MAEQTRRRLRTVGRPVDPDKFVHIDRPSNFSLRVTVVVSLVLAGLAGATAVCVVVVLFQPAEKTVYMVGAVIGAVLGVIVVVLSTLRSGRRRREDFVRCGGDPTGMTDMMFGIMRGRRTSDGNWEVPHQGSGDYA